MPPTRRSLTRASNASTLSGDSVRAAYVDTPFGADECVAPAEDMPPTLPTRPGASMSRHRRPPIALRAIEDAARRRARVRWNASGTTDAAPVPAHERRGDCHGR